MSAHHHVYTDDRGNTHEVYLDEVPSGCPRCQRPVPLEPIATKEQYFSEECEATAQVVYLCPLCHCYFIAEYFTGSPYGDDVCLELQRTIPEVLQPKSYPASVVSVSPNFARIVAQADKAIFHNLDEVAGPAYRKALEFLIKDYAILKNPEDTDTIKSTLLGSVIARYVTDVNIKCCAERAAWLGNDETHFDRLHVDYDVSDLIVLIELTARWIEMEQLTSQYGTKLQPGNRATKRA